MWIVLFAKVVAVNFQMTLAPGEGHHTLYYTQ